jgi:hypothetical protein
MSFKPATRSLGLFNVSPAAGSQNRVSKQIERNLCFVTFDCERLSALDGDKPLGTEALQVEVTKGKRHVRAMENQSQVLKVAKPLSHADFRSEGFTTCEKK